MDERSKLLWGVEVDGMLIIACASKRRAEMLVLHGQMETPGNRVIRVVDLDDLPTLSPSPTTTDLGIDEVKP